MMLWFKVHSMGEVGVHRDQGDPHLVEDGSMVGGGATERLQGKQDEGTLGHLGRK